MIKNKFFDLAPKGEEDTQKSASPLFRSKYLLAHYDKLSSIEKDLKRLPEKEEFFFLQTENSFNAFTFIPAIIKQQSVKHLYAATYSISRRVIDALVEMHDKGFIEQITLCISDSLIKRNPKTIDLLTAYVKSRANFKVLFAWSHSKVALLETANANFIIEGSGNWSENAHYEQYVFANSKGLYNFRKELFTNVNVRYIADINGLNPV